MPLEPHELADALTGRRVESLRRRGKYLVWHLDGDLHLVQHLRMSGAILCDPDPEPEHVRARIDLGSRRKRRQRAGGAADAGAAEGVAGRRAAAGAKRLVIVDQRRFGTAQLIFGEQALRELFDAKLGPEPFGEDFTAQRLWQATRGRTAPIKAFLLDQRRVAGIGNIYADEALFRARAHPRREAGTLTKPECDRLREGVIEALREGIDAKGASIDDFRHVDGVSGSFQDRFLVHRRAGEPCPRCGAEIVKLVVAGRGTYVCERCQRPPRGSRGRGGPVRR